MCCQSPHGAFVNPPPGGGGHSSGHRAGFWSPEFTLPLCSLQPAQLHRAILLGPQGALSEHAVTDERARDAMKKEQREPGLGAAIFLSVFGWRWCFFYRRVRVVPTLSLPATSPSPWPVYALAPHQEKDYWSGVLPESPKPLCTRHCMLFQYMSQQPAFKLCSLLLCLVKLFSVNIYGFCNFKH